VTVIGLDSVNDYYDVSLKEYRLNEIENLAKEKSGCNWKFIKGNLADKLLIDYITESKEEISDAMALQRRVQRFIKAEAQNITDGLNSEHKIDLMEAAALKAAHGKQSFKIVMPSNVIMIRADNEPESISKASGDDIVVNIDKMNENAERRKNKWRSD